MSLLTDLRNRLFKKEAINPTPKSSNNHRFNRFSFNDKQEILKYKTGKTILRDTTVAMSYEILKYILSSKQWVLVANEQDTDNEVYDFINNMLFNMETEVTEIVKRNIEALPWGFHIEEQLYDINEEGRLVVTNCVPVSLKTLQEDPFVYDDNNNLTAIHQEYDGEKIDIPIDKCLKYTFGDFNTDYGHGILLDVKDIVEQKINTTDWLLTFLERHSLPSLVGKTDNPQSRDMMLDAFEDMQDGTLGMTVGLTDEVQVLESNHHGETFFNTFSYLDNQIVKRFYIGDLIMGNSNSTGSYARSNSQVEFSMIVYDGILEEIANCFQKQMINPIVEANFGDIRLSPTFSFDKFTSGDIKSLFEVVKPLIDSGVVDGENPTVQDAIAMIFKKETGLNYTNEEPTMPEEDFGYQETTSGEAMTEDILGELNAISTETD